MKDSHFLKMKIFKFLSVTNWRHCLFKIAPNSPSMQTFSTHTHIFPPHGKLPRKVQIICAIIQ